MGGKNSHSFSSTNQPKNRGRKKGSKDFATELEYVYRKLFRQESEKKEADGTIKKISLTPQQELIATQFSMLRSKEVPANIKAKIIADMQPYVFRKEVEQIDLNANVQSADVSNLTTEERIEAFRELMGQTDKEN